MFGDMFQGVKESHEASHAIRLMRLGEALRCSGLKMHHGWFAEYRYQKEKYGGFAAFSIGEDLYLCLGLYSNKLERIECELTTNETQDLLSLHNEGKGWKLSYIADEKRPHPDIQRIAQKYRFPKAKAELDFEAMQVRSFLREISILTDWSREESEPAHP